MASWCGSTRSFCREQETQGRKRWGESMPTGTQQPGKGIGGHGNTAGRRVEGRASGWGQRKGAFDLYFGWNGEKISDTCNI